MAEIKFMYKKQLEKAENEEHAKLIAEERDDEIEHVKADCESMKAKRVLEAKERMQELKRKLGAEKQSLLQQARGKIAENRPGVGHAEGTEENEIIHME